MSHSLVGCSLFIIAESTCRIYLTNNFLSHLLSEVIMRESSYCFQHVLAVTILSVCLSICLSHGRISQKRYKLGSPNLHHRLPGRLVSGTVKLFHKFEGGNPERGR